jgi:hypothetical protein
MKIYQVDQSQINDYLQGMDKSQKKRLLVSTIPASLILVFLQSSSFDRHSLYSIFLFSILVISVILLYYILVRTLAKQKQQIESLLIGKYSLDENSLKFLAPDSLARDFRFEEIAITHKKAFGTMVIKGDSTTKDYYIRTLWGRNFSRKQFQIDAVNVIFIPNITSDYPELVEEINRAAKNALKF